MNNKRLARNNGGQGCVARDRGRAFGLRDAGAAQQQNKENRAHRRERKKFVCAQTAKPPKLLIEKLLIGSGHDTLF